MRIRWLLVAALAVTVVGCGGNKNRILRRAASTDLSCSEGQIRVSTLSKSQAQYRAEGCGRRATYTFTKGEGALRISPVEGAVSTGPGYVPPGGRSAAPASARALTARMGGCPAREARS